MAKALKTYENGLSIRYLKKQKKFFITFGIKHVQVNTRGNFLEGFDTYDESEKFLLKLTPNPNVKNFCTL